jgi:hypothetical protein
MSMTAEAQSSCIAVPCTGCYVAFVVGPCMGLCTGTFNAGYTQGPWSTGFEQNNAPACGGGGGGLYGNCPCVQETCENAQNCETDE